jgi:hypothetical protein
MLISIAFPTPLFLSHPPLSVCVCVCIPVSVCVSVRSLCDWCVSYLLVVGKKRHVLPSISMFCMYSAWEVARRRMTQPMSIAVDVPSA